MTRRLAATGAIVLLAALTGVGGFFIGVEREADRTTAAERRATAIGVERFELRRKLYTCVQAGEVLYDDYQLVRAQVLFGALADADLAAAISSAEHQYETHQQCFHLGRLTNDAHGAEPSDSN